MSSTDLLGLEYVLLFGLPGNKLEVFDGRTRCSCPFLDRGAAEAHYRHWIETLCRWKGIDKAPPARQTKDCLETIVAGFECELFPLPINIRVPFNMDAMEQIEHTFWWRDLWQGQPAGLETGWGCFLDHQDVSMHLWQLFREFARQLGGHSGGRSDVALTGRTAVSPDQYLFLASRKDCTINGGYFKGVPHAIAEVLSPPSCSLDRGPRMELCRQAGVPHYWILDTDLETLEVYALAQGRYDHIHTYRPGDSFAPSWCPDQLVTVATLFDTQNKRHKEEGWGDWPAARVGIVKVGERHELPDAVPTWLCDERQRLGLEYLLVLGHPDRRWELWNNRAPCVIAFGSDEEARVRFAHFLEDICRWEQVSVPRPGTTGDNTETAEVGRFELTRRGHRVHLNVALDGRKYRKLLEVWSNDKAWDWGEERSNRRALLEKSEEE